MHHQRPINFPRKISRQCTYSILMHCVARDAKVARMCEERFGSAVSYVFYLMVQYPTSVPAQFKFGFSLDWVDWILCGASLHLGNFNLLNLKIQMVAMVA